MPTNQLANILLAVSREPHVFAHFVPEKNPNPKFEPILISTISIRLYSLCIVEVSKADGDGERL